MDSLDVKSEPGKGTMVCMVKTVAETAAEKPAKRTYNRKDAAPKATESTKQVEKKTVAVKEIVSSVEIQGYGKSISTAGLIERAKTVSGIKNVKSVNVYVNIEKGKAYFVVNGSTHGDFDLF